MHDIGESTDEYHDNYDDNNNDDGDDDDDKITPPVLIMLDSTSQRIVLHGHGGQ